MCFPHRNSRSDNHTGQPSMWTQHEKENWFWKAAHRNVDLCAVFELATRNINKTALPSFSSKKYVHSGYLNVWRAQQSVFFLRFKKKCIVCIISGFRPVVDENSSPNIRVQKSWTLRIGPIGYTETSVRNNHYWLPNNPKERSSQGNVCLKSKVTTEDTWVHHCTPQTQPAEMQWNTTASPGEKNSVSAGKFMASVF
jgi:hypothetical protein